MEVRDELYDCLECMVPNHSDQLEIHKQLTLFSMATGTFGKNLAKMARDVDQPSKQFQYFFFFYKFQLFTNFLFKLYVNTCK